MLYGRGACDMKGGIAAMVVAAETLARRKLIAGDLVIATNTDEESSGAGGAALVQRGLRADGAIVTEPTGGDVWVSCRGSSYGEVIVPGRSGHAEIAHTAWRDGGAVNAIEKAAVVIEALQALRAKWGNDPLLTHERLSPPDVLPTMIRSGEWAVTIPGDARVTIAACFLPQQAGMDGFGGPVEREIESWLQAYCARDDWLASHPPTVNWWPNRVMPMEIPADAAVVSCATGAASDLGIATRLTLLAATPAVGFGPDGFGAGNANVAHAVDEFVPVDGLLRCAQALAVAALRFCNT
jgi:acetylornithine deacetylase